MRIFTNFNFVKIRTCSSSGLAFCVELWTKQVSYRILVPMSYISLLDVNIRHPRGVQGVQNEPRGVPEASRRRPRVSKKRQGGAKVDLIVFYSSKWDPEGIPEASRASKMNPNASQRRPEDAQDCQRTDQEAQSSI